jgi:hypothetical protein
MSHIPATAGVERTEYKEHVPEQQPAGKEGVQTALGFEGEQPVCLWLLQTLVLGCTYVT